MVPFYQSMSTMAGVDTGSLEPLHDEHLQLRNYGQAAVISEGKKVHNCGEMQVQCTMHLLYKKVVRMKVVLHCSKS